MTPEEIQAEWDAFIDYPEGSGKLYVTTTSALIFARTIVAMAMSRANLDAVQCTCAAKDMPVGTCCKVRSAFEKWYDEQNDGRLQPFDVFKGGWGALQRMIPTSQRTQAQAGAVPLTVDEIEQLIAQWSYELHGDRARYLVRMTEKHHGIKEGGQHADR